MNPVYSVFGLRVCSNVPILGLTALADGSSSSPDIFIELGVVPPFAAAPILAAETDELSYASSEANSSGEPLIRIWNTSRGTSLRVDFDDGATFWLDREGRHIWSVWRAPLNLDDAFSYLLGPILGLVLRLRGVVCLHASAISIEERALAFVGAQGAGKSTVAAAFACGGHAVLSDDIVALTERGGAFHILPAYPHLGLWPDSVEALFGSPDAAPRFSPAWEKRRLSLGGSGRPFETHPRRLAGLFLLGDRGLGSSSAEPVAAREALLSLVANSYGTNALNSSARASELAVLGRLVSSVPVLRLHAPSDPAHLVTLCDDILRLLPAAAP